MDGLEPIAVVGMACRFPGAEDVEQFWRNLVAGRESVRPRDEDELRAAGVSPGELANPDYVRASATLPDADRFDAGLFGMTPREAELCDPQLRVFLEICHGALEHAGYDPFASRDSVGVFGCVGPNGYLSHLLRRPDLVGPSGMLVQTLNQPDYLATLVAYKLDLRGPALTVLTACSSSLVAVHLACQALRAGECDAALAGGSALRLPLGGGHRWTPGGVLSVDGHCRPFDAAATGTTFGSGAGAVVLKRLDDAIADGDHIKAVVRASAVNNDGAAKVSFSAPSVAGQSAAVMEAMALAGAVPADIGFVEAHATGTALGDPVEVAALAEAYAGLAEPLPPGHCLLGSVKSNIGHMDGAAGIAGFIKTVLTLEREAIPGTANLDTPNPRLDLAKTPFRVSAELQPWPRDPDRPRWAGVTSLGIGGTNAHAVLSEAPRRHYLSPAPVPRLLVWSAGTETGAARLRDRLRDFFDGRGAEHLADAVATLQYGRTAHRFRGAVVCDGPVTPGAALSGPTVVTGTAADECAVAYLFPGQGAQHVGMAAGLYGSSRAFTVTMDECLELFEANGIDLYKRWLVAPDEADLADPTLAQPLLFAVGYALAETWRQCGVVPAAVLGHSLGELTAATVAGVFARNDAVRLVAARAVAMAEHPVAGGLLAVAADAERVGALLTAPLAVAAVNAARQTVVSGPVDELTALADRLRAERVSSRRVAVDAAFHHPGWAPAARAWARAFAGIEPQPPQVPFYSAGTGALVEAGQSLGAEFWTGQLTRPVRYHDALGALLAQPPEVLLEVGSRRTLTDLARLHPAADGVRGVASLTGTGRDPADLLGAVGRLWVAGCPIDWAAAGQPWPAVRVPVPGYPYERDRYWVDPPAELAAVPAPRAEPVEPPAPAADHPFTEIRWVQRPVARPVPPRSGRPALVVLPDDGEPARTLLLAVARAGWRPVRLRPAQLSDVDSLLDGAVPELVVYGATGTATGATGTEAAQRLDAGFADLLAVGRCVLTSRHWPTPPRLALVTTGAVDVSGGERPWPDRASLAALVRSAAAETPDLRWAAVDIDDRTDPGALAAELSDPAGAGQVALRGRRRWVPVERPILAPDGTAAVLRERGVYVITGGTGGLGLAVARGLAEQGLGPVLILLGRRGEHPGLAGALDGIRALGAEVEVRACDVTDPAAVERTLTEVTDRHGPVNGLLHLAGLAGDRMLAFREVDDARPVLAPKTFGTAGLEAAFAHRPRLDFAVYFGSRAASEGLVGGGDYAVANAFLDAAALGSPLAGGRVLSIGWPVWREVGMAARSGVDIAHIGQTVHRAATGHSGQTGPGSDEPALSWQHELDQARDWALDEHRVGRVPLLPATAYIELLMAGYRERVLKSSSAPVQFDDLVFLAPFFAPEPRILRFGLWPDGDGHRVRLDSRPSSVDGPWTLHTTGTVRAGAAPPAPVDLAALRGRFSAGGDPVRLPRTGRMFTQGPRWHNVEAIWDAGPERLMCVALAAAYRSDLAEHALHPAMMDSATAAIRTGAQDSAVPFLYRRLTVYADLPGRFFVHARRAEGGRPDTATGDIDVLAEDGRVLATAEGFAMRVVDRDTLLGSVTAAPPPAPVAPRSRSGLAPAVGVDLLLRLLQAGTSGAVLVRPYEEDRPVPLSAGPTPAPVAAAPEAARPAESSEPVAPAVPATTGSLEERLRELWRQALGVTAIADDQDFFDAGGNSLTAVELMARLRETFEVQVSIGLLLEARTLRQMADALREQGLS